MTSIVNYIGRCGWTFSAATILRRIGNCLIGRFQNNHRLLVDWGWADRRHRLVSISRKVLISREGTVLLVVMDLDVDVTEVSGQE